MASDTLRVLHLPAHLSDERREELFKKYGATKTRTVRRSDNYSATFVKFPSKQEATNAFLQLHQLEVMGQYLSVEFARKSVSNELSEEALQSETSDDTSKKESVDAKHFQAFLKKLNGWTSNELLSQPPPPNIWYKYALPTRNTLLRIAIQLIKEPAFYTQVLHLMNKMNLPPPFEELEDEFPLLREAYDIEKYKDILGRVGGERDETILLEDEEDEEESEMESDGEETANPQANAPIKRSKPQSRKRMKIPKFVNPAKQTATATTSTHKVMRPEDLFEPIERGDAKSRKIELKPVEKLDTEGRVPETSSSSVTEVEGGFGLMFPAKNDNVDSTKEENEESTKSQQPDCITTEELEENRISVNDQRLYPVFKNYHAGKPSCRLYIKNLARQVEEKDLHYIYRRYVLSLKNSENQYDVRLMQEGRMKGQAFITFQNVGQAQLALNDTNGYILKDKPMVVQFANAPKS